MTLGRLAPAAFLLLLAAARPPERGCAWKTLSSADVGVELLHQRCELGFRIIDYVASAKDRSIYEVIVDTGAHRGSREALIVLFDKKPEETPEAAIKRAVFGKLTLKQRRHCAVVPKKLGFLGADKRAYTISPDESYAADVARKAGDQIPPPPCGQHGEMPDGFTYFEFHPAENPSRFAFVVFGQDEHPLFDESSLKFLP